MKVFPVGIYLIEYSRLNVFGKGISHKDWFRGAISDKDFPYQVISDEKYFRCLDMGYSILEKERIKDID